MPEQLVEPGEPAIKTYTDLQKLFQDLHQWALAHPEATLRSEDDPFRMHLGWVAESPYGERFHVDIRLQDMKVSLATIPRPLADTLRSLLGSAAGRERLAKILVTEGRWETLNKEPATRWDRLLDDDGV
jgi:hypothetical protein